MLLVGHVMSVAQAHVPLLFRRLTVNRTQVAFTYAGDIWIVGRSGGEARRLTTNPANDDFPVFSPDNTQLAFSRESRGVWDLYILSLAEGKERRLTFHPKHNIAWGWTPDSKNILFASHREEDGVYRLYTMPVQGTLPTALPLPWAYQGAFSPDGKRIAYLPRSLTLEVTEYEFTSYRGGRTSPIWIANLANGELEKLSHGNSNDKYPMWIGGKIYFISDRTGISNLFEFDIATKEIRQLTSHEKYGIKWAAADGDVIAYVCDGRIYLYDLGSGQAKPIDVHVAPDDSEMKQRSVKAARWIQSAALSPEGDRLVFNARGEVLRFDPRAAEINNLTQTPGVAERYPVWSPDGQSIAYFSDESGEYQLTVVPAIGSPQTEKVVIKLPSSFYRELTWSPDSKKLAFSDKRLALWYADIEKKTAHRIDTSPYSSQNQYFPAWSPDSCWLTYSRYGNNRLRSIYLYEVKSQKSRLITGGRVHAEYPAFDRSGKYLYFTSSANASAGEYGWNVLSGLLFRPLVKRVLHIALLQNDEVSPVPPDGESTPIPGPCPECPVSRIDLEGIESRIIALPLEARDYARLMPGRAGILYVAVTQWPPSPDIGDVPLPSLYRYELSQPRKLTKVAESVEEFSLSSDGSRLLYKQRGSFFLGSTDARQRVGDGQLDLRQLEITVNPRAEWQQIYHETWRFMRDYFYDQNHHGQNLSELERHYAAYLPAVTRRSDLNYLLRQMLGHLSVAHLSIEGGDLPPPTAPHFPTGLLGADYEIHEGNYRITKVYRAGPFNSQVSALRAPLDQPGMNVKEGEYLLAVNGRAVDTSKSIDAYFEGLGSTPVEIKVGLRADGKGARALRVMPLEDEGVLRRTNWAEDNRRQVDKLSGGKLGYIFVRNFSAGLDDFFRDFFSYTDKQGLIIDQRFNGGGETPDYFIDLLGRVPLYYYKFREGNVLPFPSDYVIGPKVLLVNERNTSAAETFALMFKLGKVGQVVGARTSGAFAGPYLSLPPLIDGGEVVIPSRAAANFDQDAGEVENYGVSPDSAVEISPKDWRSGRDPQLEKAIEVALKQLEESPRSPARRAALSPQK